MSWLSQGLKKLRPVGKVVGGVLDTASDFLPPGFRDVGNVTAKLMQNKNLKSSLLGAGLDYAGGKLGGAIAGKLGGRAGNTISGAAGNTPQGAMSLSGGFSGGMAGGMPVLLPGAANAGGGNMAKSLATNFGSNVVNSLSGNPTGPANQGGGGWSTVFKNPGVIEAGLGLAGSALAGYGQGQMADKDRAWEKEKFGVEQAPGLQRQIEQAPLRDKAMYLLMQRMGMQPQQFAPHDIYNPSYGSGAPQLGGYDQNALNAQNAAYKPGAGGTSTAVQQMLLQKLGYAPKPATAGR